jgi:sterol desaturase/sphingolipid hydroxylase (fatty acid hydroxylase superfamily)
MTAPISLVSLLLPLVAGAATWTLLEYLLHRFVFHARSAKGPGAREHRQHHARPDYFAPWWQKALAAVAVTALLMPGAAFAVGVPNSLAFTLGFIAMYLLYEVLHRRAHTHPPRGAYGRWRRRNHFAHHFADPRRAHGVTSPIWDRVFGTGLPAAKVRVPRRLAMRWLVGRNGEVRDEFASDYVLVGAAQSDERTRRSDSEAAMQNRSPEAG